MKLRPAAAIGRHVALFPFLLISLVPVYIMFISAFKTNADIQSSPLAIPVERLTLDNVVSAITNPQLDIVGSFGRTIIITLGSVGLALLAGGMISYVLARSVRRSAVLLYVVLIAGILIPSQVLLIPVTRVFQFLGIDGTLFALIAYLAALHIPYVIFIYVGFIRSIPRELDEAATVDGAGAFTTYWRIIFPVLKPATAAIAIFTGLSSFNNFLDPLIILGPSGGKTVTTGIYSSVGQFNSDYGSVFGSLLVAVLPVMIAYFIMQRQFIDGLTEGSVKG